MALRDTGALRPRSSLKASSTSLKFASRFARTSGGVAGLSLALVSCAAKLNSHAAVARISKPIVWNGVRHEALRDRLDKRDQASRVPHHVDDQGIRVGVEERDLLIEVLPGPARRSAATSKGSAASRSGRHSSGNVPLNRKAAARADDAGRQGAFRSMNPAGGAKMGNRLPSRAPSSSPSTRWR